jgi:hypothetical protein
MNPKYRRPRWLAVSIALIAIVVTVAIIVIINNRRFKVVVLRDEKITVVLTSPNHPSQLAYENEVVKVAVGCDQYLNYLEILLSDEFLTESRRIEYNKIKEVIERTNSCDAKDIFLTEHSISNLLEQGMASVFDKRNQTYVTSVSIWYYESICGPTCGGGSRSFYLPDGTLFLEVIDWIS